VDATGHRYQNGPSACAPRPSVIRSIQRQIRSARALSRADVRLATAMRLVSADSRRPLGFNDSVFYPVAEPAPGRARRGPYQRVARAAAKARTLHALALLVDFSDQRGKRPRAELQKLLFDPKSPGSMASYYRVLSKGALAVTGEVAGWIRAPRPYRFYTNGESGTGEDYPKNTPGLLHDALVEFCKSDDLRRFDVDGDGYVDGIFLVHAGGGAEAEPDPSQRPHAIWSHKWVLPRPFESSGVRVYAYSTEPEDGRVGVFAHEFGHVLGLPDLYDTSYRTRGIGDWCLMAGGSWGGGGNRPVRMSAWCLAQLGWIRPRVVRAARSLVLSPLEVRKSECYRLWTKGRLGPEYFLLENRQKTGLDAALPGSGLAVWHVDESQSGNTNPLGFMVGLVQADGQRDLERNRNSGDAGDLFPGARRVKSLDDETTPSTRAHDGSPTGVALSAIARQGSDVKLRVRV
jgi:immune inhibitor A